jgi:hypothetical protein
MAQIGISAIGRQVKSLAPELLTVLRLGACAGSCVTAREAVAAYVGTSIHAQDQKLERKLSDTFRRRVGFLGCSSSDPNTATRVSERRIVYPRIRVWPVSCARVLARRDRNRGSVPCSHTPVLKHPRRGLRRHASCMPLFWSGPVVPGVRVLKDARRGGRNVYEVFYYCQAFDGRCCGIRYGFRARQ